MKRGLIIAGALILLLIIIGGAYYFLNREEAPAPGDPGDPFGFTGGTTQPPDTILITLTDGKTAYVPDFTKEPQPSWASAESGYQVAGSDEGPYHILYFPDGSGFLISLFAEPLGLNRLQAEEELKAKLKLPEAELCKLSSQVATSIHVNETYAGYDLGLSFCPGAIEL